MSGTVIARNVEPGQTIGATDVALVMSDRLVVKAQVDETDIARIKTGQAARIVLDAYSDQIVPAAVGQIAFDATTVENVTTYEVDVLPQKLPPFMRSGMTANVNFLLASHESVVIVPTEAVLRRAGATRVLLPAAKTGKPEPREVQVGISDGRRTEIVSGLNEGDTVLVPTLPVKRANTGTAFGQPARMGGGGRR
jgi:macrolide-specific efflux system membrane fusion protein